MCWPFSLKGIMPKEKKEKVLTIEDGGFYKGYDIKWLKKEPSHPDHYLVAEYEALKEGK